MTTRAVPSTLKYIYIYIIFDFLNLLASSALRSGLVQFFLPFLEEPGLDWSSKKGNIRKTRPELQKTAKKPVWTGPGLVFDQMKMAILYSYFVPSICKKK